MKTRLTISEYLAIQVMQARDTDPPRSCGSRKVMREVRIWKVKDD